MQVYHYRKYLNQIPNYFSILSSCILMLVLEKSVVTSDETKQPLASFLVAQVMCINYSARLEKLRNEKTR